MKGPFEAEPQVPPGEGGRVGILVANLGSPAAPTAKALRRYLGQFLGDQRVVELPRLLWLPLLHGIILRTRPRRSAAAYQKVWTEEGAPLPAYTARQAEGLQERMTERYGADVTVTWAMRYGEPSVGAGLDELKARGCDRILIFPMYPQYAGSTTGSLMDAVAAKVQGWRWIPSLRMVPPYYAHPAYLDALAAAVRDDFAEHGAPDRLLLSFHGLPRAQVDAGDPYAQHCQCTAHGLADRLNLGEGAWKQAYQSRFGPAEWLTPATDTTLREWGEEGLESVAVACPGFPADCLETLEEIALGGRETFEEAGGGHFRYISALNDRPEWLDGMQRLAEEQLGEWLPGQP